MSSNNPLRPSLPLPEYGNHWNRHFFLLSKSQTTDAAATAPCTLVSQKSAWLASFLSHSSLDSRSKQSEQHLDFRCLSLFLSLFLILSSLFAWNSGWEATTRHPIDISVHFLSSSCDSCDLLFAGPYYPLKPTHSSCFSVALIGIREWETNSDSLYRFQFIVGTLFSLSFGREKPVSCF